MAEGLAFIDPGGTLAEAQRGDWIVLGFADVEGFTKPVKITFAERERLARKFADDDRLSPDLVAVGIFLAEKSVWGGGLLRLTPVSVFGKLPYAWLYPPPGLLELLLASSSASA